MKRVLLTVVALALAAATVFAGGGKEAAPAESGTGKPVMLTFATQGVGTGMYVYANAMTTVFKKELPTGSSIDVTTTSPGGLASPLLIEKGECELTLSNNVPAKWASTIGLLGNPPSKKIRAIAGGIGADFVNVLFTQQFVDKTGIKTIEELVQKKYPVRIAIKTTGSFGELACQKVFEVLGVKYDDIKAWGGSVTQTGSDAIVSLLKDGKADMTIDHVAPGQAATTELCMTTTMFFPQMAADTLKKLNEVGFDNVIVPPNTWKNQTTPVTTVGSPQVLIVSSEVDDATVYALTKALAENKAELVAANAALATYDPTVAWQQLKTGAELHEGAKKYYVEKGLMK